MISSVSNIQQSSSFGSFKQEILVALGRWFSLGITCNNLPFQASIEQELSQTTRMWWNLYYSMEKSLKCHCWAFKMKARLASL